VPKWVAIATVVAVAGFVALVIYASIWERGYKAGERAGRGEPPERRSLRDRREHWSSSGTLEPEFAFVITMIVAALAVFAGAIIGVHLGTAAVVGGMLILWPLLIALGWLSQRELDRHRMRVRAEETRLDD
jgi:hypothetical protein